MRLFFSQRAIIQQKGQSTMKEYLTKLEAAEELSVSIRTIERMVRNGLPVCSLTGGRVYRIKREDLVKFLDSQKITALVPEVPDI